jgi:hypothetical protein
MRTTKISSKKKESMVNENKNTYTKGQDQLIFLSREI